MVGRLIDCSAHPCDRSQKWPANAFDARDDLEAESFYALACSTGAAAGSMDLVDLDCLEAPAATVGIGTPEVNTMRTPA